MDTSNLNWDGMAGYDWDVLESQINRHPSPGQVLPNGARVIAASQRAADRGILLALVEGGQWGHEYVVWSYAVADDAHPYRDGILTYGGHYFGNVFTAAKVYARKCGLSWQPEDEG